MSVGALWDRPGEAFFAMSHSEDKQHRAILSIVGQCFGKRKLNGVTALFVALLSIRSGANDGMADTSCQAKRRRAKVTLAEAPEKACRRRPTIGCLLGSLRLARGH